MTKTRAVDPHSFYADPDPAVFLNADPDPAPAPAKKSAVAPQHCLLKS